MIYIGFFDKKNIITDYCIKNNISKIWSIGESLNMNEDNTSYANSIEYNPYYRLRSSIATNDLIVLNEILVNKNRNDLHYNCIRQYVIQTKHRIAFQKYPLGCMEVLSDMMQDNPFLKEAYNAETKSNLPDITIKFENIILNDKDCEKYRKIKELIFAKLKGSPAVLPRQCLKEAQKLTGGDDKSIFNPNGHYIFSQLGVDKYFYEQLKKQIEVYNEYKTLYG